MDEALDYLARELPGWMLALYWPTKTHGPRAVLIRPDYKVQIARHGATVIDSLYAVIGAAMLGAKK